MPPIVFAEPGVRYPRAFLIECLPSEDGPQARVVAFESVCLMPAPLAFALKVVSSACPADAYHEPIFVRLLDGCEWPQWAGGIWKRDPRDR